MFDLSRGMTIAANVTESITGHFKNPDISVTYGQGNFCVWDSTFKTPIQDEIVNVTREILRRDHGSNLPVRTMELPSSLTLELSFR